MDSKGRITPAADTIIKECKKIKKDMKIHKECGKSMVELASFPSVKVNNVALNIIRNFKLTRDVAEKNDLVLYPFSLYPMHFTPNMRSKRWYTIQEDILGKNKFKIGGKVTGFHYHYTLPRGVFDKKTKFLKPMLNSKVKQTLIDSYNLGIAIDPILIALLQSSPFYDNQYLAKDSRVLIYRGGGALKYPQGMYTGYTQYGGLPPYKQTLTDLIYSLKSRHERMKRILEKQGIPPTDISKYGKILDFCWGPVRINKLGTLEQRSADMNYMELIFAMSVLMKYAHKQVHQEFMRVIPSEFGLEEPFKLDGDHLLVPPHTHVRKYLQYHSAHEGLDNKDVYNYCNRFFKFAKQYADPKYDNLLKVVQTMLDEKKTTSDKMISYVKKKGYGLKEKIPDEVLREMCLDFSERGLKHLDKTEELVKEMV